MRGTSRESNFIRHRVRIRIDGYRPERLLSRALEKGLACRNVICHDETEIYCTLSMTDYRKLKKLAGHGYRLTIIKEGGTRPGLRSLRMNKLMLCGMMLFILFYLLQFCFIREISVLGCETIPEDELRTILREEGLYEGCPKTFDCERIEKRIFDAYEQVVWTRVAYQGSFVQVEVAEGKLQQQKVLNREKPCHLVAEQDCYIETVRTFKGRAKVEKGDFVRKGGILISGKVPIEHPTYPVDEETPKHHYVHAEGEVTARVPYYYSIYVEHSATEARQKAEIRKWMKKNIPENAEILNKDFHFEAKKNIIKLYGMIETRQPVGIEKEISIDKRQSTGNEKNAD
ncbi:MAG: sporulation protein YqfD [Firmicutes bacterium]|nr:sporulation protein YqfD [Bacillota bacterium]